MGRHIAAHLAILAASYLVGAFIAWDYDPGNWDVMLRLMVASGAIIACVVASLEISINRRIW